MLRSIAWMMGWTLVLGLSAWTAAGQASAFDGTYVLQDGETQRATMFGAADVGTRTLASATRTEIRSDIEDMLMPSPRVVIRREGTDLVVIGNSSVAQRSKTDNVATTTVGGWTLRQRIVNGVLERRLARDGWLQVERYSLSADRRTLTIDLEISAPSMTQPVRTRVTYQRQ